MEISGRSHTTEQILGAAKRHHTLLLLAIYNMRASSTKQKKEFGFLEMSRGNSCCRHAAGVLNCIWFGLSRGSWERFGAVSTKRIRV
jgi:hypothetical protein